MVTYASLDSGGWSNDSDTFILPVLLSYARKSLSVTGYTSPERERTNRGIYGAISLYTPSVLFCLYLILSGNNSNVGFILWNSSTLILMGFDSNT
ncbi:MAG: hypothetical protein LUQ38_10095, partial [Methanotrichaceae archaeon]|nr:hypothetical protein [Methanotrichaceae archaeon]